MCVHVFLYSCIGYCLLLMCYAKLQPLNLDTSGSLMLSKLDRQSSKG